MSIFSTASSKSDAGPGDGGLEGVQVADHQVDGVDPLAFGEASQILGDVAAGEDAAVELEVEGS